MDWFVFFAVDSSPHLYLDALFETGDLYFAAELSVRLIVTDSVFPLIRRNGYLFLSPTKCFPIPLEFFVEVLFLTGDLKVWAAFSSF